MIYLLAFLLYLLALVLCLAFVMGAHRLNERMESPSSGRCRTHYERNEQLEDADGC